MTTDELIEKLFPGASTVTLSPIGEMELHRLLSITQGMGIITEIDYGLIIAYATAFQRWREMVEVVNSLSPERIFVELKSGYTQTHPAVSAEQKYFNLFRQICQALIAEFKKNTGAEPNDDADEIENILRNKDSK